MLINNRLKLNSAQQKRRQTDIWLSLIAVFLISSSVILPFTARVEASTATRAPELAPTLVSWHSFTPTGWSTALPIDSTVVADAPGGLDSATAAYAISTDGGGGWSSWSTSGLTTSGAGTAQTLSVVGLTLLEATDANLIRFRIQESGGALEVSPDYVIPVDVTVPTSTVTSISPDSVIGGTPAIQGTASDGSGSGIDNVTISIRASASGLYWDGSGWVGGEIWLAATGAATWSFDSAQPAWVDGAIYNVRSRATDSAGQVEIAGTGVSFTYDSSPPTVTLLSPNGGEIWAGGQVYTITWTADDLVGLATDPITLSVFIQRRQRVGSDRSGTLQHRQFFMDSSSNGQRSDVGQSGSCRFGWQ